MILRVTRVDGTLVVSL
jgi:hypothetical protein